MEESMVARIEKVSDDNIYDDVALVILSKLPLKSLSRFCCVRKSWSLLFKNSYFMNMFRKNFLSKNHYYNDTSLFLQLQEPRRFNHRSRPVLYSVFGERFQNMVKLDWPNPFQKDEFHFSVRGCVNGILCIEDGGRDGGILCIEELQRIALWNTATEEFKATPPSPFAFESPCWDPMICLHGFGYDQVNDDYKVIRHVSFYPATDEDWDETWKDGYHSSLWEIYCLKSDSWRKIDIDMPTQSYGSVGVQAYIDGVCHWWGESETRDEVYLVSFDLSSEVFVKTSIPLNIDDNDSIPLNIDDNDSIPVFRHLIVLNGSIGLILNYAETTTFHISILGEIGVKESWIKLFVVGPLSFVKHPIGVGKNGDIFFRKKDNELICFNLITQKIEDLGVKGETYGCQIILYKESLLPIERITN